MRKGKFCVDIGTGLTPGAGGAMPTARQVLQCNCEVRESSVPNQILVTIRGSSTVGGRRDIKSHPFESNSMNGGSVMNDLEMTLGADETGVFDADDLVENQTEPLHSIEPGLIKDSGDLCDSDCQDCD